MAKNYKTGGRQRGSLNKVSKDLKTAIKCFLENNFDEAVKQWEGMTGKEKLSFYTALLPYVIPKQTIEMENTTQTPEPITGFIIQLATPEPIKNEPENNKND